MNLLTVAGPIPVEEVRLADGHAHAWISPPAGVAPESRLALDDYEAIRAELADFRAAGASTLIDCQPGGCGRDAGKLRRLAEVTGLHITATTGFHRPIYYPASSWLWSASAAEAAAYFVEELTVGTRETRDTSRAVRVTTIKVGYEGVIDGQTRVLMEAAAHAAAQTGAALLFHTERGKNVEALLPFFADRGLAPARLYLCHMDKRPDLGLHRELAQAGVLLGYDTFARPGYKPEQGAWPLIRALVSDGLDRAVAIGLDLAYRALWRSYGGQPGLVFLPEYVVPRLRAEGMTEATIRRLTALNIAERLVWNRA
jgi:phosphotriesterase-related protein